MRKLKLKKCLECGSLIHILKDCNCADCEIKCCSKELKEVKSNSTDAAFEKHVPTYEIRDGMIEVSVNHVMEDDHYIEWICFVTEDKEEFVYLKPEMQAIAQFKENKGTLYAYCNKHGLWENEIK